MRLSHTCSGHKSSHDSRRPKHDIKQNAPPFLELYGGERNTRTEEIEVARERKWREVRQTLPGLLAFGVILLLTLVMLLMLLAEFRGFYLDQIMEILRPG